MHQLRYALLVFALAAILFATPAKADSWRVDPDHSAAHFAVQHLGIGEIRGFFSEITGTAVFGEPGNLLQALDLTIAADSIETGVKKRDNHLRSHDFFDAYTFPTLTFHTKKITPGSQGKLQMTGDLTMHGVTREITVELAGPTQAIQDPLGNTRRGARLTTRLNRTEFGLTYNAVLDGGRLAVGETVEVGVDLELIRQQEACGKQEKK